MRTETFCRTAVAAALRRSSSASLRDFNLGIESFGHSQHEFLMTKTIEWGVSRLASVRPPGRKVWVGLRIRCKARPLITLDKGGERAETLCQFKRLVWAPKRSPRLCPR